MVFISFHYPWEETVFVIYSIYSMYNCVFECIQINKARMAFVNSLQKENIYTFSNQILRCILQNMVQLHCHRQMCQSTVTAGSCNVAHHSVGAHNVMLFVLLGDRTCGAAAVAPRRIDPRNVGACSAVGASAGADVSTATVSPTTAGTEGAANVVKGCGGKAVVRPTTLDVHAGPVTADVWVAKVPASVSASVSVD
jgi:hypothetical protein